MKLQVASLRTRLLLLVLLAFLPAFGLIGYSAISQRQQAIEEAEKNAMNLVRLAINEQRQIIASTRQLLFAVSLLPVVKETKAAEKCSQTLAELRTLYPYYTNLGVATVDGNVFCSAMPFKRTVNISDRGYFRRALESRGFGIGDYQIGRITGVHTINFGYPVLDINKEIKFVVYAALDLSWLNRLIMGVTLPVDSAITVIDGNGTILARYPNPEQWIGKSLQESPLVRKMLTHQSEGTAKLLGLEGVPRFYAFGPLHDGPSGNVYVSVGIPEEIIFYTANNDLIRNIVLLLLVAALALISTWIGSDIFILRGINVLAVAARRFAKGDLNTRTSLPRRSTRELGQLADAFNDMAIALQSSNRALKVISAGNQAHMRVKDEQALLVEMCRVIVEVGGYGFAWVGYAEHDERRTVRPVAQAGFEGGLERLAQVVANVTWSDSEHGRGPTGNVIRTGNPVVLRHLLTNPNFAPWREDARKRGYGSAAAFPLRVKGQIIGALSMYAREDDAFDENEMRLLKEAAEDLAFGIEALRIRAEREHAHEIIEHMAYYDELTELPNRAFIEEHLKRVLLEADLRKESVALLLLDTDRLQEINDAFGFQQGDLLLKEIGKRLRSALADDHVVARMRGDEFAVLLPSSDIDSVIKSAEKILQVLEPSFLLNDFTLNISAAVGIALFPEHATDAVSLIRQTDVAMHQTKKNGKRYGIYSAEEDNIAHRVRLAGELRRAIESNQLVLHYQPKIDLRDGHICGVEALVRWNHPLKGMIPPDEFIPLAEHTGLIKPLTYWVLDAALYQVSIWRKTGLLFPVAVNLSARNLHDDGLLSKIKSLFQTFKADATWLELEITESGIMDDPVGALKILRQLSDLNISLFIDDFGIGHSSLAYLMRLPVRAVKIDKSFVINMSADSAAIVRSTIMLAHDLNLEVVAEGIESQIVQDQLTELGCDSAQGYFISRPLSAEKFNDWCGLYTKNTKMGKTG